MPDKRGRPPVDPAKHKIPNGLTVEQWEQVQAEAGKRNLPAAYILREAWDHYYRILCATREKEAEQTHLLIH
jgi:hypothetical protein